MNKDNLAIVGWEEGVSGLVHSFIETYSNFKVKLFIHPFSENLELEEDEVMVNRVVKNYSFPQNGKFKGVKFKCEANWIQLCAEEEIDHVLIAISNNKVRQKNIALAKSSDLKLITVIHPSAQIMPEAVIGVNCILLANSFAGYRSEICDGVILNTGASIDHHTFIDECASIDPGVVIAGNSSIGKLSKIHTGSIVINNIRIGSNVIVGAGSLVLEDIQPNVTVYGSPAKIHYRDISL
jgi:serine O-acetyltransferase